MFSLIFVPFYSAFASGNSRSKKRTSCSALTTFSMYAICFLRFCLVGKMRARESEFGGGGGGGGRKKRRRRRKKNAREQDAEQLGRLLDLLPAHLAVVRLVGELNVHPAQRVGRHGVGIGRERWERCDASSGRAPSSSVETIDVEPLPLLLLLLRSLL